MKKLILSLAIFFFLAPASALAAKSALKTAPLHCYSTAEAEADQGIRIHSELMVIGLNCQHMGMRHGQNLYGTYRQFTADNADIFGDYETTLINFFKRTGAANPVGKLNDLRTRYANKISTDAAKMRPDIFCGKYGPRVMQAAKMKKEDIRKWASMPFDKHPVSYPMCAK
jgi:hypothetical protein